MIPRILSYKNPVVPQATSEKCAKKIKEKRSLLTFLCNSKFLECEGDQRRFRWIEKKKHDKDNS